MKNNIINSQIQAVFGKHHCRVFDYPGIGCLIVVWFGDWIKLSGRKVILNCTMVTYLVEHQQRGSSVFYFIHCVSKSIQLNEVLRSIQTHIAQMLEEQYSDYSAEAVTTGQKQMEANECEKVICRYNGYVQAIDYVRLDKLYHLVKSILTPQSTVLIILQHPCYTPAIKI